MKSVKERFGEYLINIGKSNKTMTNYISALNTVNLKIEELDSNLNFFDSEDDFLDIIEVIETSKEYNKLNLDTHNGLSAAISAFKSFLESEELQEESYFSIKISNPDSVNVVNAIKSKRKGIVIDQINQLRDNIQIGQLVFMVPFGDKVSWEKGLTGIGKISKLPYDFEGKNFKIKVDMFCSFDTIHRSDLIYYPGTYDAADIGPSTKGSQNQALKQISMEQAVAIIRAIVDLRPETVDDIKSNINSVLLDLVFGKQEILQKSFVPYVEINTDNQKGYNKIYYGIPGCGKSYYIENTVLKDVDKEHDVFRTTFYLDYSNTDFVGQIYPIVEGDKVSYSPVPGPFTKALERAYSEEGKNRMIYLVIEEINRGNAAAIFGDLFQLLDRLEENKEDGRVIGDSEYPISNVFIEDYFKSKGIEFVPNKIIIPHNLTLLATMNTSDQNVFPLDTAFKRRWNREKVETDWEKAKDIAELYIPFTDWTWGHFADRANFLMIHESSDGTITEDKKLGPYFVKKDMLVDKERRYDKSPENIEKLKRFVNNVIDYLFYDVAKFEPGVLFDENLKYDNVYDTFLNLTKSDVTAKEAYDILNIFKNRIEPDANDDLRKTGRNED